MSTPTATPTSAAGSSAATSTATNVSIPPNAPVGGLSFTKPPATTVSYYKIAPSISITFGWNFTGLYIQPTSLTVSAYCASNQNTYPVGPTNGIIPGTATEIVWQPWTYQTAQGAQTPLAQATYTLQIQDGQGTAAIGTPGEFQYNTQMTFALYTPQAYTPLTSYVCPACSSASGPLRTHPAVLGVIVTALIMLLSGWSLIRTMARRER